MTRTTTVGPLVTFGETMLTTTVAAPGPLRTGASARVSFAGAESTVALGMARLGHRAVWCGRVGDDAPGRLIVETLSAEGVDVRAHVDPDASTGAMLRYRRTADVTEVAYQRGGSAAARMTFEDVSAALDEAGLLHVTGITPALAPGTRALVTTAVAAARRRGVPVSLDVNFRERLWSRSEAATVLREVARASTVVFAGVEEMEILAGGPVEDGVAALRAAGVDEVVLKDGRRGATAFVDGERTTVPARSVTAVDPVGAGDSFVAGYLSARAEGLDVLDRLDRAVELGAWSVSSDGDWEGLPSRADLSRFRPGQDVRR